VAASYVNYCWKQSLEIKELPMKKFDSQRQLTSSWQKRIVN